MYGKIFDTIFDSTLMAEGGWLPSYIFMAMISLADKDGYVEVAPKALATRLGFRFYDNKIAYADFESALTFLQEPDAFSKSPDYDGRRIIPISELDDIEGGRGFWIVNYAAYRQQSTREDRAEKSALRSKKWREAQSPNAPERTRTKTNARKGHTDTDTDTVKNSANAEAFNAFWNNYPFKKDKKKAEKAFHRLSKTKQDLATSSIRTFFDSQQPDYYLYPATYLNNERWNDELTNTPVGEPVAGAMICE